MACNHRPAWCVLRLAWIAVLCSWAPLVAQDVANRLGSPSQSDSVASGQDSPASDLAAAAKLARQQQAAEKGQRTERSQAVNEMAGDLAREQEEPIAGAPTGYRYYYFKEGDYAILIPADAKPEARDYYGLRLRSAEALSSRIEVILGEPIPALGDTPEEKIHNANAIFFEGCAFNLSGLGAPVDGHPAASVGYSGCWLNQEVFGSAELVLGDGYVVPVVCGYPMTAEDYNPNPQQPIQKVLNKYDRERNGLNVCKLILPSLHFHPYGNRWNPKSTVAPGKRPAAVTTQALISSDTAESNVSDGSQSLGTIARTNKKVPTHKEISELRRTAAGYTPFDYRYYCTEDRVDCYSLSLLIPDSAKRNQQFLLPYIGLFQFEVPLGSSTAVIQATTGPPSESGFVSRQEIINTKADWYITYVPAEHYSGVGAAKVLDEQLTEISGIPTRLTTFRNPATLEPVLTYMASYLIPGKFVHVRCSIPEKVSGDLQSMCETVLRSIEVQMPKPIPFVADDPQTANDPTESQQAVSETNEQ
jgi:hypothetical protein